MNPKAHFLCTDRTHCTSFQCKQICTHPSIFICSSGVRSHWLSKKYTVYIITPVSWWLVNSACPLSLQWQAPRGILIRCPNHPNAFLYTQRSSCSTLNSIHTQTSHLKPTVPQTDFHPALLFCLSNTGRCNECTDVHLKTRITVHETKRFDWLRLTCNCNTIDSSNRISAPWLAEGLSKDVTTCWFAVAQFSVVRVTQLLINLHSYFSPSFELQNYKNTSQWMISISMNETIITSVVHYVHLHLETLLVLLFACMNEGHGLKTQWLHHHKFWWRRNL